MNVPLEPAPAAEGTPRLEGRFQRVVHRDVTILGDFSLQRLSLKLPLPVLGSCAAAHRNGLGRNGRQVPRGTKFTAENRLKPLSARHVVVFL